MSMIGTAAAAVFGGLWGFFMFSISAVAAAIAAYYVLLGAAKVIGHLRSRPRIRRPANER